MFIGIDASLTCTGICIFDSQKNKFKTQLIKDGGKRGPERLEHLNRQLAHIFANNQFKFEGAALEGYAMGVRGGRLASIGEWGGLIRMMLYRNNIPTIIVPPKTLKKYLVCGNAEKNKILLEVFKKYGIECGTDDEADALVLADMARHQWGGIKPKSERQKEALQKAEVLIEGGRKKAIRVRKRRI